MVDRCRYVTTDQLVTRIERELRAAGATFDDIDERVAAELGVAVEAWSGYLRVRSAADRYQNRAVRLAWRTEGGDALGVAGSRAERGHADRLAAPDRRQRTGTR